MRLIILFFSLLIIKLQAIAQTDPDTAKSEADSFFIVSKIKIEGNRKTKTYIILRELNFKEGDTLYKATLKENFLINHNRLFNTALFVTVDIEADSSDQLTKDVLIKVKERWYTYPNIIFELADRNFNEWWEQRGHDINRTNYGIYFDQKNVRGRNENLKLKIQLGFTKQFEFNYSMPYINKNQKTGLGFNFAFNTNKQLAYRTLNHKLEYLNTGEYLRKRIYTGLTISRREKFYQFHSLNIGFSYNTIADTIAKLNPEYFFENEHKQSYFTLRYNFVNDKRDISYYPLRGYYLRVEVEKNGLTKFEDVNILAFKFLIERFVEITPKLFFGGAFRQKISFPNRQPYSNYKGLGYGIEYVSGYELYVIDGRHFSLSKVNFKYKILSKKLELKFIPIRQFNTIPFSLYLRLYSEGGYVSDNMYHTPNNPLANAFLWGNGAAIDFVSYYDFVFRFEYSFNRLGESGIFLHVKAPI
jgi:outer membrane protein assembly factor BamA